MSITRFPEREPRRLLERYNFVATGDGSYSMASSTEIEISSELRMQVRVPKSGNLGISLGGYWSVGSNILYVRGRNIDTGDNFGALACVLPGYYEAGAQAGGFTPDTLVTLGFVWYNPVAATCSLRKGASGGGIILSAWER